MLHCWKIKKSVKGAAQACEREARVAVPAFPPADTHRQEAAAGFARQEAAARL